MGIMDDQGADGTREGVQQLATVLHSCRGSGQMYRLSNASKPCDASRGVERGQRWSHELPVLYRAGWRTLKGTYDSLRLRVPSDF